MEQLGADENGRISYSEFLRRRMQLINEINALTLQEQAREHDSIQSGTGRHSITMQQASPAPGSSSTGNWPTSSDSQGMMNQNVLKCFINIIYGYKIFINMVCF